MKKPHIRKLSPGSRIFECVSRIYWKSHFIEGIGGHGLSPREAFAAWEQRRDFIINKTSQPCGLMGCIGDIHGNPHELAEFRKHDHRDRKGI